MMKKDRNAQFQLNLRNIRSFVGILNIVAIVIMILLGISTIAAAISICFTGWGIILFPFIFLGGVAITVFIGFSILCASAIISTYAHTVENIQSITDIELSGKAKEETQEQTLESNEKIC